MIPRFLGAIKFLTIVPVRRNASSPGESAIFFPLIGAALGAIGGAAFHALSSIFPQNVAALIVLALWALLTGALHEDGFADVADAFRAGRSRDKILTILKDSRIGAHGALALILICLVRWQALSEITENPVLPLATLFAVSRSSLVLLAWISPPAGSGLGFEFSRALTSATALIVLSQAILWAAFSGAGVLLLPGAFVIIVIARKYFIRRVGGVTGDCLGATCLIIETWGLILFTCRRCV
jgi:cobalamin 5'-phosphate synthase/cobalamin synthase